MALPEPKDDVERLCYEIAEAMFEKDTGLEHLWSSLPTREQLRYAQMARVSMEMVAIHMKAAMMDIWWGADNGN